MGSNIPRSKEEVKFDLLANVVENHEGCWLWQKSCFKGGYGQQSWEGKNWKAHRLSYYIFFGGNDDSLVIRHRCGNRRCCNPLHLEAGTHKENSQDTIIHGRSYFTELDQNGSNNIAANFTEQQVYDIRLAYKSGNFTLDQLAEQFGVNRKSVERTVSGVAYSCYQDIPPFDWYELDQIKFQKRLTRKGVAEVQKLLSLGKMPAEISKTLGVSRSSVNKVKFKVKSV